MKAKKPVIAITLGDPAGIGPELVLKALISSEQLAQYKLLVLGSKLALRQHASSLHSSVPSEWLKDGAYSSENLEIEDLPIGISNLVFGANSAECGAASFAYLARAIELGKNRQIDAIVTGPIQKESWNAAGIPHIGHTEALADGFKCHTETIFVVDKLRIFFLTRHVSLREAIDLITNDRVRQSLHNAKIALHRFGIKNPKIAVAGLNPHAGNSGMFGDEEIRIIAPAVAKARAEGVDAYGPLSADSVFHQAALGDFDGVISLYHDQGHIAAKMRSFLGTVAVTTGLPIIRTSVDHGTAFDIAGKGCADPTSLLAAIHLAAKLTIAP